MPQQERMQEKVSISKQADWQSAIQPERAEQKLHKKMNEYRFNRVCKWCGSIFGTNGKTSRTCNKCPSKIWIKALKTRKKPGWSLIEYLKKNKIRRRDIKW